MKGANLVMERARTTFAAACFSSLAKNNFRIGDYYYEIV